MSKINLNEKIKRIDPGCGGQYIFICFAEYKGETLIVFREIDDLSIHAKQFDVDSVFVPFKIEDEFRFDIFWSD